MSFFCWIHPSVKARGRWFVTFEELRRPPHEAVSRKMDSIFCPSLHRLLCGTRGKKRKTSNSFPPKFAQAWRVSLGSCKNEQSLKSSALEGYSHYLMFKSWSPVFNIERKENGWQYGLTFFFKKGPEKSRLHEICRKLPQVPHVKS